MMRPCLGSTLHPMNHILTPNRNGRCNECTRVIIAATTRGKRRRRPYTRAILERRAQAVKAWRDQHGDICPGWQRQSHHSTDLTADHPTPVSEGGDEDAPLAILCRQCNSRKGTHTN
jgi:5-methylcytosine-specific restriction endonuclease McrA